MDSAAEKKLVELLKKGDIGAFDELFARYSKRIYCFALSYLKNREDSEGIVQEVFFRIWKNRHKVNEHYSFKSFLFTISYNLIMDRFREKMKDQVFLDKLISKTKEADSSTDDSIDFHSLNERYWELVEQLPPRRKKIYKLSRLEGCSYKEISNRLEISINTVENQMGAALKYLRNNLGQESLVILLFYYLFV